MQLFGLAATVFVLPVAVWGWRIATHRPFDREWMRLAFWLAGSVFAAGLASCLPASPHWPLPSGLGGVIGDAMLRLPEMMLGSLGGMQLMIVAAIFGTCTLAAVVIATGFGYHDPSDVKLDERWAQRSRGPRGQRRGADLDLAGLAGARLAEHEGPHHPAGDAPLGAACAEADPPRADAGGVATRPLRAARRRASRRAGDRRGRRDRDEAAPRARKPAVRKPARRSGGFQLPELSLLALPKSTDKFAPSPDSIQETRNIARKRAGRLRRARPDHQRPPRSGGHALRARARAGHQVVARDRTCRRHRPLDERALRARCRGVGPQRHRHRAAERQAREGLFPRDAVVRRIHRHPGEAAAVPRQDHRRRAGGGRPRAHAASADRRHHRLGQVGRHQHHDPEPALPADARAMPADHGRSQDARAFRL